MTPEFQHEGSLFYETVINDKIQILMLCCTQSNTKAYVFKSITVSS